jgi:transcription elongation factor GreB
MTDGNYITPNGVQRIKNELDWLRRVDRPRVVAEVSFAASLGDRSENAEYIYGKKRLRRIDSRVGFLIKCLNKIRVVDPDAVGGETVRFGATVMVEDESGDEKTYRIYGQHEVDVDAGILSHKSPIARAMLGKKAGDAVTFRAPGGLRELEILSVQYEGQTPLETPDWKIALDGCDAAE